MELTKLAAEAFGSGRLQILKLLPAQPYRYSEIARRLEMSDGEISRHLQRLHAAGLVEKQATGAFVTTPLARLVLAFEGGLGLLARHDGYFRTHDVAALDAPFIRRLDELAFADFLADPIEMQAAVQRVFEGVRGRFDAICLVADHMAANHPIGHLAILKGAAGKHGTRFRLLLQQEEASLGVPFHKGVSPNMEFRTVPVSRVDLAIGDGGAVLAFSSPDGHADFNQGFFGTEGPFVAFCSDYFEAVWASARPVPAAAVKAAVAMPIPKKAGGPRSPTIL